jgi:hypothetical protein
MIETPLTTADLIPDEPLDRIAAGAKISADLDLLNHRSSARRVAELAGTANGHLNISVFGPWGSGKSSFFGMLEEELAASTPRIQPVRFDAWQNSGPGFEANFLAVLSEKIGSRGIEDDLFTVKRTVRLPFGLSVLRARSRGIIAALAVAFIALVFLLLPLVFSLIVNAASPVKNFPEFFRDNALSWAGFGASGSVALLVLATILELSKVSVEESTPSHVTQFRALFHKLMTVKPKQKYAILVDELDRCAPDEVMQTLEGLRTFLGHDQCVFVVAFDRAAVSETIARHSKNQVPMRPDAPYYATAGEYLDKIFQFQLSLPPQPLHVSRRYALSLVSKKSGVWGEIRAIGERQLERVVSILSPIHLRSPRRTKVLLNAFAVNARVYESLGFDWKSRVEEIAVWTVIQTEFPRLALDLENAPKALYALAGVISTNLSPVAIAVRDSYSMVALHPEALDEVVDVEAGPEGAPGATNSATKADAAAALGVVRHLRDDLHSFLQKCVEMGCTLPRADLILMHSGGDLLRFDDLQVYNALVGIADASRSETLAILSGATVPDKIASAQFILEQLESAPPLEEESALRIISGELASELDREDLEQFDEPFRRIWRAVAQSDKPGGLTVSAAAGLLRSFAASPADQVESAFSDVTKNYPQHEPVLVTGFAEFIDDSEFSAIRESLLKRAISFATSDVDLLKDCVRRADLENQPVGALKFSPSFVITKPTPVEAAVRTPAAIAVAEEETAAALVAFGELVASAEARARDLTAMWPDLRQDGPMRPWILENLRAISVTNDWASALHDELITTDLSIDLQPAANLELLAAIADQPWHAAGRWIPKLDVSRKATALEIAPAVISVALRAMSNAADPAPSNAVSNLKALSQTCADPSELNVEELVPRLRAFCADDPEAWTATRIASATGLLTALISVGSLQEEIEELLVPLYSRLVAVAKDGTAEAETLLASFSELPLRVQGRLVDPIEAVHAALTGSNEFISARLLVAAQVSQAGTGQKFSSLPAAEVIQLVAEGISNVVQHWLLTSPDPTAVEDVLDGVALANFDDASITAYGATRTAEERSRLWADLMERGDSGLASSIASPGVENALYATVADHLVSLDKADDRSAAASRLMSLPRSSPFYKQAVLRVLTALADRASQADLTTTIALVRSVPSFTGAERTRVQLLLSPWIEKWPKFLPKSQVEQLSSSGLIPAQVRRRLFDFLTKKA